MKQFAVIEWTMWDGGERHEFDTVSEAITKYEEMCRLNLDCALVEVLAYHDEEPA